MKYFMLLAVMAFMAVGCGDSLGKEMDIFEQAAEAYTKAADEVQNAGSLSDVEDIVIDLQETITDIEESDEMKLLMENEDTLALEEYEEALELVREAASRYADVLVDKCAELGM
ncbi:MAG: hypothetical protein J6K83_03580 [Bacteroidaceae bacterium]|nr:hypothetical protein [Bacteroidaceae bacterium]